MVHSQILNKYKENESVKYTFQLNDRIRFRNINHIYREIDMIKHKIDIKEDDILCLIPYGHNWPERVNFEHDGIYRYINDLNTYLNEGENKYFIKLDSTYTKVCDLLNAFVVGMKRVRFDLYVEHQQKVCNQSIYEYYFYDGDFSFEGDITKIDNCWLIHC